MGTSIAAAVPIARRATIEVISMRPLRRWFVTALLGGFCATSGFAQSLAITMTDDAGKSLSLSQRPTRIVSLSPGATELLFAAGAGDRVVGTVIGADAPEAAKRSSDSVMPMHSNTSG